MATQVPLERCGVVLLNPRQGMMAPGPKPRRNPSHATGSGSDTPGVTRGEQSNATGYQQSLRSVHWNAKWIQRKNLRVSKLPERKQHRHLLYSKDRLRLRPISRRIKGFSSGVISSTDKTVRTDQKAEY